MNDERRQLWPIKMAGRAVNFLLAKVNYQVVRIPKPSFINDMPHYHPYDQDSLYTIHNHDFMEDPQFRAAYQRGMQAHGEDAKIHWRVHVALWVAENCNRLEGDFVECGVNKGIFSSCIMKYLNWNSQKKHFFLFDTFQGIDPKYLNEREKELGRMEFSAKNYPECFEQAKENFQEFDRTHLVRGSVPDTLGTVEVDKVCYLSIDMNCAAAEIAAAEYFWPKMARGAMALLDDYAYVGYGEQKKAFDEFAAAKGIPILSLPTGQGLYIKP